MPNTMMSRLVVLFMGNEVLHYSSETHQQIVLQINKISMSVQPPIHHTVRLMVLCKVKNCWAADSQNDLKVDRHIILETGAACRWTLSPTASCSCFIYLKRKKKKKKIAAYLMRLASRTISKWCTFKQHLPIPSIDVIKLPRKKL